ncbi:MAG: SPOR domain-containing protein [Steroidobacteraceae bacterium]
MDRRLKERLVGATILVVLIVLIVPELLSGPKPAARAPAAVAGGPVEPVRNVTVDLATSKATPAEDLASAAASSSTPASPPSITTLKAQQPTQPAQTAQPAQAVQPALEKESSPPNAPLLTPKPGTTRETASVDGAHHSWAVQIGSFASRANAEKQMRRLKVHDSSIYVSSSGKGTSSRYRVRVGPFADRAAAEKVMMRLRKEGQFASLVAP